MNHKQFVFGVSLGLSLLSILSANAQEAKTILGRWDVTVRGPSGTYPSWFEFERSGNKTIIGRYVGQFGSARPVAKVDVKDGSFRFVVPPQWENRTTDVVVEGKLVGDTLKGETTGDKGETLAWEARRAPALDRAPKEIAGAAVPLFNGTDLTGWKPQFPDRKNGWKAKDGVLANVEPGNNLMTEKKFTDFRFQAEVRYPKGSNGGIYLRGRYEVQVEDDFGHEPNSHKIGGVYGFLTPSLNSAKKAGEWQTVDITLVGRHVTVVLNGERIIDRQIIPGITGGALDSNEGEPGPILLQGDHGPLEFREIKITAAD